MDPVTLFLLSVAAIFVIGALGEIIFQRTNVPDVIWLILAGILLGPVGGFVTRDRLESIAPYFAAITLVVVLFEGGSALRLRELSRAAPRSSVLAVMGFLASALGLASLSMFAAWIGWLPEGWGWMHGLLLGCILGGSSSIIIMPAMAQARLEPRLANLVNLESALTDAFCVVGTSAIIDIMLQGTTGAAGPAMTLARSFGIGFLVGGAAGIVWLLFLRFLHSNEHAYPVTLSALLVLYVLIDKLGGSAALGILTVAIILGNAPDISKKIQLAHVELDTSVRGFHRQMAFIIKSFFFVFIGAMLGPPWGAMTFGVVLGGALLVVRVPAVRIALVGSDLTPPEKNIATVCMPRGMAAGVLATLPFAAGVPHTGELPQSVFACVLTTILIFAVGFPIYRSKIPATDPKRISEVPLPAGAARPSLAPMTGPEHPVHGGGAAPAAPPVPEESRPLDGNVDASPAGPPEMARNVAAIAETAHAASVDVPPGKKG